MIGRIGALLLRYLYLYRRSLTRSMEILFWPVMELLVWGFVTAYLERLAAPKTVVFLLGGVILWDVFYRSQQAITLSISEEIWVRNLVNVFITPIRVGELMLATCLLGVLRAIVSAGVLGLLAWILYAFRLTSVGPALLPFLASLVLFGWAVGMFTMGLIVRFGHAAEALIWGIPFLIQPVAAVFYPVDVLPVWLQRVAYLLPATYVFEGMREALASGRADPRLLVPAFAGNAVYLAAAAAFFGWMLARVREKGYLVKLGME
ncbi:MAG: ABC transporter permease [Thermoanaerobaculia bacterium]